MMVDLAGSERLKAGWQNREETAMINKSLFCLGKVVTALSERTMDPTAHVPYRDSILTKLLMEGLGGDALTLLIVCCSPCDNDVEETLNALIYAQKAKGILTSPMMLPNRNEESELKTLRKEVKWLREENVKLRNRLNRIEARSYPEPVVRNVSDREERINNANWNLSPKGSVLPFSGRYGDTMIDEISALKNKLQNLEHQLNDRAFLQLFENSVANSGTFCPSEYAFRTLSASNGWPAAYRTSKIAPAEAPMEENRTKNKEGVIVVNRDAWMGSSMFND